MKKDETKIISHTNFVNSVVDELRFDIIDLIGEYLYKYNYGDLTEKDIEMIKRKLSVSAFPKKITDLIYKTTESIIINKLKTTNSLKSYSLRILDGITLKSEYVPAKQKINNLTGEKIYCDKKIKCKAQISRRFADKLNRIT